MHCYGIHMNVYVYKYILIYIYTYVYISGNLGSLAVVRGVSIGIAYI